MEGLPSTGGIFLRSAGRVCARRWLLSQDSFLFQGTIRENIRFGRLDATDEEVEEAAKLANAHSFIVRMKDGYDKKLKPDGGGISQGQKRLQSRGRFWLTLPCWCWMKRQAIDTVTEIKIQEGLRD